MKIIPADFKRKINFWEETQYKNKRPMFTGRHIMFQVFLFFDINKTREHTMNLSGLLNVELHNGNLNKILLAFGNDLDDHVLDKLFERQVKKVYTHEACDDTTSARHLF